MSLAIELMQSVLAQAAEQAAPAPAVPAALPAEAPAPGAAPAQPQSGTIDPAGNPQDATAKDAAKQTVSPMNQIIPILLMLVVIYFFMFRGPQKRQKELKQLMDSLKRGDRVRTIGGILGTVVDVRDDEVVLKVDESTNTKIKVIRSAIGVVLKDKDDPDKKTDAK